MRDHTLPELGMIAALGGLVGFGAAWLTIRTIRARRTLPLVPEPRKSRSEFVATMAD